MKRVSLFIALALVLSLFSSAGALPDVETQIPGEFDGYIVKLSDMAGPRLFSETLEELDAIYPAENLYVADSAEELDTLRELGILEYAEPNYKVTLFAPPNDPYYERQWNLREIGAEAARDAELTGAGVRVAVIDSGINAAHEDFAGVAIEQGRNLVDGGTDVTDIQGHGTRISGIIAAASDNGRGIAGMSSGVTIIPFKCFADASDTTVNYIIEAIYSAINNYGADIINLSLGLANNVQALKIAIDYAESRGVCVISAVGNNSSTSLFYPAAYDSVIGVGSVGKNKQHSTFSQINNSVFVVAPGEDITTLNINSTTDYAFSQRGTSYAAPHVTALAAIALDYNRKLTPAQIRNALAASCDDLGASGYDQYYGHGLINTERFLAGLTQYGTGNTAPAATHPAYAMSIDNFVPGAPTTVDMTDWFFDEDGDALTYGVYSSTAAGSVEINGAQLTYKPAAADAGKAIRFVIEAKDREKTSEVNTILTIRTAATGYSDEPLARFVDLSGHWARPYAAFAVAEGLINGVDEVHFAPDAPLTRATFVTLLARMSGQKISGYPNEFLDVSNEWFAESVAWASSNGIVAGISPGYFGPNMPISRQQIAVFLYRYAMVFDKISEHSRPGVYYGYTDSGSIADWASDAMLWAVSAGIIGGKTAIVLDPNGGATRAEAATTLYRFLHTYS